MRKILWCGGSHLGNAKIVINAIYSDSHNEYYVTAAPLNRDWSAVGGRYFVDGSVVGNNAQEPDRRIDLADYDRIIFVGQYIQPQRYARPSQMLSSSLVNAILERDDCFTRLPGSIFNEPISLFPSIAKGKCVLLCDPWQRSNNLPIRFMERFANNLNNFCEKNNIQLLFQPESTLERKFSTHNRFSRSENAENDRMHFNEEFWRLYMQDLRTKVN